MYTIHIDCICLTFIHCSSSITDQGLVCIQSFSCYPFIRQFLSIVYLSYLSHSAIFFSFCSCVYITFVRPFSLCSRVVHRHRFPNLFVYMTYIFPEISRLGRVSLFASKFRDNAFSPSSPRFRPVQAFSSIFVYRVSFVSLAHSVLSCNITMHSALIPRLFSCSM